MVVGPSQAYVCPWDLLTLRGRRASALRHLGSSQQQDVQGMKSALGNQDMHLKENFQQYYFSTVEIFKYITNTGKVF